VDELRLRALRNGGLAALLTLLVGSGIVAAVSDGGPSATGPSPSPSPTSSPTAPVCVPSWEQVASADPSEASNALLAVTAISAGEAWAVGATGLDPLTPITALVQRWDGTAWTAVEAPSPGSERNELLAVDASEPNDVWAVGRTASGFGDRPLAIRFDGTAWTEVELPSEVTGVLTGVSAISPTDVWIVGYTGEPAASLERALLLHWDGALWAVVDPGRAVGRGRSLLHDVVAISPTDVWAAGYLRNDRPLVIRFDGQAWSRSEIDGRGALIAIEPVATTEAWAVGAGIRRFDGVAWEEPTPASRGGELRGVAAVVPADVWAVGSHPTPDGTSTRGFALRWNGQRWQLASAPRVPGSEAFTGVDALPDGTVLAVGHRDVAAGRRTFAAIGRTCPPGT